MVTINRAFDVPGLAGSSMSGETVYIHRAFPRTLRLKDGSLVQTDRYLLVHEVVEKTLMDSIMYTYEEAHELATAAERCLIEADGFDWQVYDAEMQYWITLLEHEVQNPPPDLHQTS